MLDCLGPAPRIVLAFRDFAILGEGIGPVIECGVQRCTALVRELRGDVFLEILAGFFQGHGGFPLWCGCHYTQLN